jgi:hypothetical protein
VRLAFVNSIVVVPVRGSATLVISGAFKSSSIQVPSPLSLSREQASLLPVSRLRQTRRDLARFWIAVRGSSAISQIGTLLRVDRIALNALQEIRLAAGFLAALMTGGESASCRQTGTWTLMRGCGRKT